MPSQLPVRKSGTSKTPPSTGVSAAPRPMPGSHRTVEHKGANSHGFQTNAPVGTKGDKKNDKATTNPPPSYSASQGSYIPGATRIVHRNEATNQALQINAPIGTEGFREVSYLEIADNKADGRAIQTNHAISQSNFNDMLAAFRGK